MLNDDPRLNTDSLAEAELAQLARQVRPPTAISDFVAPYTLGACLGRGGAAAVFEATGPSGAVVLKIASPVKGAMSYSRSVEALKVEAEFFEALEDAPNLARMVESHVDATLPFLVFEQLGISLDEHVFPAARKPNELGLGEALIVVRDISCALTAIHESGRAHLDVKPENILRGPEGWTLIDPGAPDLGTDDYRDRRRSAKEQDIVALGRVFLAAYFGYEGWTSTADFVDACAELDDHPGVRRLVVDMLGETRRDVPSAAKVGRRLRELLRRHFRALFAGGAK